MIEIILLFIFNISTLKLFFIVFFLGIFDSMLTISGQLKEDLVIVVFRVFRSYIFNVACCEHSFISYIFLFICHGISVYFRLMSLNFPLVNIASVFQNQQAITYSLVGLLSILTHYSYPFSIL